MLIIGAGMAGLLAAHMLRRHRPHLREAQAFLPNNHSALLRFRTDAVSRATGIPFTRVWVTKGVVGGSDPLRTANQYAFKVAGSLLPRSILNLEPGERYVAPSNFIFQLAEGLNIQFGDPVTTEIFGGALEEPIISTIPMPTLMNLEGWDSQQRPDFSWRPIWTVRGLIIRPSCDLYQTLYYPDLSIPWYRISITGCEVIAESMTQVTSDDLALLEHLVIKDFGLPPIGTINWNAATKQEFGKLAPADDQKRRAFILAMTDRYRIYSLGRFATWRQILLDDVVHDVQVIEKFITERDAYSRILAGVK